MRNTITVLLTIMIVFLSYQLFNLFIQHADLENSSEKLNAEISSLKTENRDLTSDIDYYSNPQNLEKELKSQSNYKEPGEKVIIVIPPKTNSTGQ